MSANSRSVPGVFGFSLALLAIVFVAACSAENGAPSFMPEPAACTDLSSTTPPTFFTPGPAPDLQLTSREKFLLTSPDGGASLLKYVEASGSEKDYRVAVSQRSDRPQSLDLSFVIRISGDGVVFVEEFRFEYSEETIQLLSDEQRMQFEVVNSLQMTNVGETVYARASGFEKWIDVSDAIGTPQDDRDGFWLIRSEGSDPEDGLCDVLFEMAFSVLSAEEIIELEAEGGMPPVMEFIETRDSDDKIRIEHVSTVDLSEGFAEKHVDVDVHFLAEPDTKRIIRAVRETTTKSSAFGLSGETTEITEVMIEYGPQDFEVPSVVAGTIETDPGVIAEFLELME